MRLFVTGMTLLVGAALLSPAAGDAFAPKPPSYTAAAVQFRDSPGDSLAIPPVPPDAITSDGSAYVDGAPRGLEVRMWINGSQDLTIGTFMSGRKLRFSYTPASVINPPAPSGSLEDNAFVNIRQIADMPIGTRITKASFNTAIGYFRWLGSPTPAGGSIQGESFGSQAVRVQRTDDHTWLVDTPDQPVRFPYDGTDYFAGDLSVLLKDGRRGTLTPVALYSMPFGLTVTCDGCPPAPAQ